MIAGAVSAVCLWQAATTGQGSPATHEENMETQCRRCSQRLRYPDSLRNPLLRCPTCGETFRPATDALDSLQTSAKPLGTLATEPSSSLANWKNTASTALDESVSVSESRAARARRSPSSPVRTAAPEELLPDIPPPKMTTRTASRPLAGMGWLIMILALLAFKAGPRLFKHFARERQPQNVPQRMNEEDRQALEKVLRDLRQQMDEDAAKQRAAEDPHQPAEREPLR